MPDNMGARVKKIKFRTFCNIYVTNPLFRISFHGFRKYQRKLHMTCEMAKAKQSTNYNYCLVVLVELSNYLRN